MPRGPLGVLGSVAPQRKWFRCRREQPALIFVFSYVMQQGYPKTLADVFLSGVGLHVFTLFVVEQSGGPAVSYWTYVSAVCIALKAVGLDGSCVDR